MRILFLIPYTPSPIRVRPYQFLRALARRGHQITLICPTHNSDDEQQLATLRPLCAEVISLPQGRFAAPRNYLRALPGSLPLQAAHSLSQSLVAAVRKAAASGAYDAMHIEHLRGAEIGLAALFNQSIHLPVIFDAVDCISLLFERALRRSPAFGARLMAFIDLARTRRYEAAYQDRFAQVVVTSPEDSWALATLREQHGLPAVCPPQIVPNGVDLDYFAPQSVEREPASLVFSGKMSYHANHAAALYLLNEIMPRVWQQRPEVKVTLVGANPAPALQAFAQHNKQIQVTGYVADIRPYLARASLAVCPIRYGVGIQNKVLEAMAMATPVIAAQQAAVALHTRPEHDLLLAGNAQEFAAQILHLLDTPQQQAMLGSNGRRYVEQQHSWDSSAAALENCYTNAH
jgi:polysaccharide biosynthesis protein PslH